jgi:hypothetical protein
MTRTPAHVRAARRYGQPAVLYAALALSAPGEFNLATMAGWSRNVAWLMPAVMSLYAAIGASVSKAQKDAAKRCAGTPAEAEARRRATSATRGALMALLLATAAQVADHLLTTAVVGPRVWVLVVVSSVPPLVAAHVLHIDPPTDEAEVDSIQPAPDESHEAPVQVPSAPVSTPLTLVLDVEPTEFAPNPQTAAQPVLVSYREAAEALGLSDTTIRGWANGGTVRKYPGPTPSTRCVDLVECKTVQARRVAAGV